MRMSTVYQEETYKDYLITLIYDDDPIDPRDWDTVGKMVCFHNRYRLGDKHDYKKDDFSSWDELLDKIIEDEKPQCTLPLYLYDHSGITISTSPFECRWDSGQIGFIYATEESIKICGRVSNEELRDILISEVRAYDDYLRGNCIGYKITKKVKCEHCNHVEDEEMDSCWGFYPDENGNYDYVIEECKSLINSYK